MNREILSVTTLGGLCAVYRRELETGTAELLLVPAGTESGICRTDCAAEPLVQAKLRQDDAPTFFSGGQTMRSSPTTLAMEYAGQTVRPLADRTVITTRLQDPRGMAYTHTLTLFADNPAAEVTVSAENTGTVPLTLEMLSSFTLGSLSPFGQGLDPETLVIHRMRSHWSAEGRLVSEPAEDLQLEPSWKPSSANSLRFGCVGSLPVRGYVPFCGVEDTVRQITWAAATTQGSSWQMELYRRDNGLSLSGGLADAEFGAWSKALAPGESFTAPKAVLTAVRGGVDQASRALAENTRRAIEAILPDCERELPVIFNEFCSTWGCPTEESVLRQVRSLAGRGIGYYVIDAGWYDDRPFDYGCRLGRWQVSKKSFPRGLGPVVDAIHQAGMKAGIWFEFEMAGRDEPDCFQRTDWLLHRHGIPITVGDRRFWDLRKPEVQDYLARHVIDFLRDNRLDYLKVDYNETIGLGCDGAESLGEGLRGQIEASTAFFARIRRELPDLVLEICASGGHRLCHAFLELGYMASFSDAHECDEIPVIAANMHRMILPRQSQIWAVVKAGQPLQKLYYQLCSGLLGRLCLSGEPDALSAEQWAVIEQGIRFYRKAAPVIDRGETRRYGRDVPSYRAPRGWQGLVRRGAGTTLAVVHTFAQAPGMLELPVRGTVMAVLARPGILVQSGPALYLTGLQDFDGVAVLLKNEE